MAFSSASGPRRDARSWPAGVAKDARASRSESPTPDARFPRSCRLTSRRQFREIYDRGISVGSSSFRLFGYPNSVGHSRLGITVTRKVGGAVKRNRVKRMLREVFRLNRAALHPALDLVVNAHISIRERTVRQLEGEFVDAFDRLARRFR